MIPISITHDAPLVWDAEHAATLREKHRIIGAMMGCLPRCPHQNSQLGLPLKLLNEEVALLVKKGICCLVSSSPVQVPTAQEVEGFTAQRAALYEQQSAICKEQRKEALKHCRHQILEGKRAKRQKLLEARKAAGEDIDEEKLEKELEVELDSLDVSTLPESAAMVQICTATPRAETSAGVVEAVDWSYPETAEERLRCGVFEDLWEKGYHITAGAKFGGDFLIYPGDPLQYHSFYVGVCLPYQKPLTTRQLVAFGRLGSTVKKTILLCSTDDQENFVYTSLEWTHIS